MIRQQSDRPVFAEVDLDEMDYDSSLGVYTMSCRCGDGFRVQESDLEKNVDTLECGSCSFIIKLLYEEEQAKEN